MRRVRRKRWRGAPPTPTTAHKRHPQENLRHDVTAGQENLRRAPLDTRKLYGIIPLQ